MGSDGMGNREKAQYLRDSIYFETERHVYQSVFIAPKSERPPQCCKFADSGGRFFIAGGLRTLL